MIVYMTLLYFGEVLPFVAVDAVYLDVCTSELMPNSNGSSNMKQLNTYKLTCNSVFSAAGEVAL